MGKIWKSISALMPSSFEIVNSCKLFLVTVKFTKVMGLNVELLRWLLL